MIAGAGLLWLMCFIFWGFTGELVCSLVAFLYPTYASFKAVEDAAHGIAGAEVNVDYWLRYWLTYAFSMLTEGVFYAFLSMVPFYHLIRLVYIVWLFFPATNGAQVVYAWGIAPLLRRYRPVVEMAMSRMSGEFSVLAPRRGASAEERSAQVQELMAQEMAKAGAAALGKAATRAAAGLFSGSSIEERIAESPGSVAGRGRCSSPRPTILTQPQQRRNLASPVHPAAEGGIEISTGGGDALLAKALGEEVKAD